MSMSIDYRSSGVDVAKGDEFVDWIQQDKQAGPEPFADRVVSGVGGFASIFDISFPEMKEPCLVSATDGVGTKLKLAVKSGRYDSIGQDLVAMCVNDLVCCGGRPLFFLDYFACGKLDLEQAKPFLAGVKKACHDVGARLIGGETAEMPGVYRDKDFDCAGFAVGIVDKQNILGPELVKADDIVIGVHSSGFHSNGYSLLRKVYENDLDSQMDQLLKPTALYVNLVLELHKKKLLHAVAHITGGGMENIGRVLPKNLAVELTEWEIPKAFMDVKEKAGMSLLQLLKTLNAGIGLSLVIDKKHKAEVETIIKASGFGFDNIGNIVSRKQDPVVYFAGAKA